MQQFKGQSGSGYKKTGWVCLQNTTDYSPFGVSLDGRTIQSDFYRFGFNGMEKDDELKGAGNSYTTELRQYDPRLGRWLSLDPLAMKYADISPYVAYVNNPILFVDSDGDSIRLAGTSKQQWNTLAFLQTLTNDKLTIKNNTVIIEKVGGANPNKELPSGTGLIIELVSHKRNVVIGQNSDGTKSAGIYENPNSFEVINYENANNGVGLDALVRIDLTQKNETTLLIEDPETGKSVWKKTARESSLAHELVHAFAYLNGQNLPKEEGGKSETYKYKNELGKSVKTTEWKEETDTVGITGNRKYTENKIRSEQGWGKRVKY
jgi:RHS repeat-associated protein